MPDRPDKPSPPSSDQLAAAHDRTIPDVIGPDLRVLFAGINPGLYSAATGHHFARPGNRFWPTLHRGGFTPRQFRPDEQHELLDLGIGITNFVARATAKANELTSDELHAGGRNLIHTVERYRPGWLAVLGVTAYRAALGPKDAKVGEQKSQFSSTKVWLLPNPSGLNAHWTPAALAEEFGRLKAVSG
ncbi:mismatch-specific DNA-glycosylase [Prauserella marina]|uniref:TDG/mug DNA glycosylase family protein n=1 Tax=Prauserella marina TaxID=530584 RepID=A0A222VY08_9PSEU|nr:G/U mismatch-specific DNA glycosylase [Prauserella marina]ASR38702.1 mismatch-specific DNA-glycosylase [Prauserella marina]PWV82041.1 G/U mismatch-specific uracil-DNA glycosylase [Prauserella marina]SDD18112.1 TDG/mug DNA glycosylase family protein [Prauserella marina]